MSNWIWLAGYVLAGILIWLGFSGRVGHGRPSTKQLFIGVGLLVLIVMIGITLDKIFNWWGRFPMEVLGLLGIGIVIDRVIRITVIRFRAGAVVLDLGRIQGSELIINIIIGLGLGWYVLKDLLDVVQTTRWKLADISFDVLGLSMAVAVLLQTMSKRALCERGIYHGTGLLPWEKITRFDWEKETASSVNLVLYKRVQSLLFGSTNLTVRTESVTRIEEVLHQHALEQVGGRKDPPLSSFSGETAG